MVDMYGKLFDNPSMHTKVMTQTRKSGWSSSPQTGLTKMYCHEGREQLRQYNHHASNNNQYSPLEEVQETRNC